MNVQQFVRACPTAVSTIRRRPFHTSLNNPLREPLHSCCTAQFIMAEWLTLMERYLDPALYDDRVKELTRRGQVP